MSASPPWQPIRIGESAGGWILVVLAAACSSGCGRYVMGTQTLYPPDIKTVYVQMFDSTSFRVAWASV